MQFPCSSIPQNIFERFWEFFSCAFGGLVFTAPEGKFKRKCAGETPALPHKKQYLADMCMSPGAASSAPTGCCGSISRAQQTAALRCGTQTIVIIF
jgi:hypothetical protein